MSSALVRRNADLVAPLLGQRGIVEIDVRARTDLILVQLVPNAGCRPDSRIQPVLFIHVVNRAQCGVPIIAMNLSAVGPVETVLAQPMGRPKTLEH
jgi:hypothetical protein